MANKSASVFENIENYLNKRYSIRFNVISLTFEFSTKNSIHWKELEMEKLYIELEKNGLKLSFDKLLIYLKGSISKYNPFVNYFKNQLPKWDEIDYIDQLCNCVKVKDEQPFFNQQFKKWLVRTVLCACEFNSINKNAIILYSSKQNIGKTTFIRYLVPESLKEYIAENITNDKDSMIKIATNLIINLDEMQNFVNKDLDFIKSLISKDQINERLPYGKKSERILRRASFIGSTNRAHILKDNSNVRWIVFEIESFDFSYSSISIENVWSQAVHLAYYDKCFNPYMMQHELDYNEEKNKRFRAFSREEEEILAFVEESTEEKNFMTSTELSFKLRNVFVHKNPVTLGKILNNIGFKSKRMGDERTKKYMIKLTDYYFDFMKN